MQIFFSIVRILSMAGASCGALISSAAAERWRATSRSVAPRRASGTGHQRRVVQPDAEIERLGIGDHRARILVIGEHPRDEFVDAERLGAGDFARRRSTGAASAASATAAATSWAAIGWNRACERRTASPSVADLRDPAEELEELGGVDERVGDRRRRDQRAPAPAWRGNSRCPAAARCRRPTGRRDAARPAAASAAAMLRPAVWKKSIAAWSSKDGEFETSTTTSAPVQRVGQALAGEGVDARVRRGGDHLMALLRQEARRPSTRSGRFRQ